MPIGVLPVASPSTACPPSRRRSLMMSAMRRAIVRAISSYSTITKGTRSLEAGISEKEKARYKFTLYVRSMLVLAPSVRIASDSRHPQNRSRELSALQLIAGGFSGGVQGLDSDLRMSQIAGSSGPNTHTEKPRRRYVRARFSFSLQLRAFSRKTHSYTPPFEK